MTALRFRKKPVEIEAMRFADGNNDQVLDWIDSHAPEAHAYVSVGQGLVIQTFEGDMLASDGDWIIREPFPTDDRRFYPVKPEIFDATYEPITDPPRTP